MISRATDVLASGPKTSAMRGTRQAEADWVMLRVQVKAEMEAGTHPGLIPKSKPSLPNGNHSLTASPWRPRHPRQPAKGLGERAEHPRHRLRRRTSRYGVHRQSPQNRRPVLLAHIAIPRHGVPSRPMDVARLMRQSLASPQPIVSGSRAGLSRLRTRGSPGSSAAGKARTAYRALAPDPPINSATSVSLLLSTHSGRRVRPRDGREIIPPERTREILRGRSGGHNTSGESRCTSASSS